MSSNKTIKNLKISSYALWIQIYPLHADNLSFWISIFTVNPRCRSLLIFLFRESIISVLIYISSLYLCIRYIVKKLKTVKSDYIFMLNKVNLEI